MSAPRAVGVRAAYPAVPPPVRAWVDSTLGSPVVEAREQVGGMSPGCATRLVCADGTRAFIKAVGAASEANSAERSETPSGTGKAPWSAYGTRTYSAWLPANPPRAWL